MKKKAQKIIGGHWLTKSRCYRSGNTLYCEGDGPKTKVKDDSTGKIVEHIGSVSLVASAPDQRFEDHQLEGIENIEAFFHRVNHVMETDGGEENEE